MALFLASPIKVIQFADLWLLVFQLLANMMDICMKFFENANSLSFRSFTEIGYARCELTVK